MSNARIFFAGVGTTIVLLAAGFGGGLMLARTAMEPVPQNKTTAADSLPPARVVLPASAEAAPASQAAASNAPAPAAAVPQQSPAQVQAPPVLAKDTDAPVERDRQAERAEKRKADADERRRKYAERKARREAARIKRQQQDALEMARREQSPMQPGIMAFGGDEPARPGGFFGN